MKILVVSPFFPYPPDAGGAIRIYELLRYGAVRHRQDLLCYYGPGMPRRLRSCALTAGRICCRFLRGGAERSTIWATFSIRFPIRWESSILLREGLRAPIARGEFRYRPVRVSASGAL